MLFGVSAGPISMSARSFPPIFGEDLDRSTMTSVRTKLLFQHSSEGARAHRAPPGPAAAPSAAPAAKRTRFESSLRGCEILLHGCTSQMSKCICDSDAPRRKFKQSNWSLQKTACQAMFQEEPFNETDEDEEQNKTSRVETIGA